MLVVYSLSHLHFHYASFITILFCRPGPSGGEVQPAGQTPLSRQALLEGASQTNSGITFKVRYLILLLRPVV